MRCVCRRHIRDIVPVAYLYLSVIFQQMQDVRTTHPVLLGSGSVRRSEMWTPSLLCAVHLRFHRQMASQKVQKRKKLAYLRL
jgi:hypothetical protein